MNLDLSQLKYLSDEQRERYMSLEKLYRQPGWALVVKQAAASAEEAKLRAAFATSWDVNRANVGQYHAYLSLANMEEATEAEFAAVALSNATAESEEAEAANE